MPRERERGVGDGMGGEDGGMRIVLDISFFFYLSLYITPKSREDVPIR